MLSANIVIQFSLVYSYKYLKQKKIKEFVTFIIEEVSHWR